MEIVPHGTSGVNGGDGRSVEDAMSRPFHPGTPCARCLRDLGGVAYRVSFMGEPTATSTPLCGGCFSGLRPGGYVYAKRVEVRRD